MSVSPISHAWSARSFVHGPSGQSLSLQQRLEPLAHAFGMDKCLQLQPGANLLRFALPRVVQVGKFVAFPQSQQKGGLRSKLPGFQPRPLPPGFERREIHVRGQVLLARHRVEIFANAVVPVRQQRSAHVALVKELLGAMPIVNRDHKSSCDAPTDLRNPVARFEPCLRVLAFAQRDGLRREIFVDRASRNRPNRVDKLSVVPTDENLLQHPACPYNPVHRQRVDKFIRENATCWNLRRNFRRNPQMSCRRMWPQSLPGLLTPQRRPFHRNVTHRCVKFSQLGGAEIQNVLCQTPHARSRLHQQKFLRPFELLPHPGKFPRQQPAKNRVYVYAGVVIGEPLRFCFAVIAVHGMVQAFAHEIGKREGAAAANAVGEQFFERRHAPCAPAAPEVSSVWSFFQVRSKISFAASSNSTKCTLSSEVSPRKCSAASRNMIFAHSSSGNPAMPVPMAGNAMLLSPRSFAILNECAVEFRSASAVVAPPSRMLAAWITNRAFNFPPEVIAAYPTGIVPISLHSLWMASPPFRRIAPATPPPKIKSLFAALTMASVSFSVRSPCSMSILSASDFISGTFLSQFSATPIHTLCGPTSTSARASSEGSSLQKLLVGLFIKTENHLRTDNQYGTANQIRFLSHQLDSFRARRRMLFHVSGTIQFVSRIQEFLVIALSNQRIQFGFRQPLRAQVTRFQFGPQFQQETSCLAASCSRRLVQEFDLDLRHARSSVGGRQHSFARLRGSLHPIRNGTDSSPAQSKTRALIAGDAGIDFERPALDSSGQGLGALESLKPQPCRRIQASHAVVAVTNHFVHVGQRVQAGGQRAKRNMFRSFNTANLEFPGLAHVNEHNFFAPVKPGLHFRRSNLELVHILSFILPSTPACVFRERRECLPARRAFVSARTSIRARLLRSASENRTSGAAREFVGSNGAHSGSAREVPRAVDPLPRRAHNRAPRA